MKMLKQKHHHLNFEWQGVGLGSLENRGLAGVGLLGLGGLMVR